MMAQSTIKERALERFDLLESVVAFKKRFYPRGWADYDAAKPGTLKLMPPVYREASLRRDYRDMRVMIYGQYPDFNTILEILRDLEDEINAPRRRP